MQVRTKVEYSFKLSRDPHKNHLVKASFFSYYYLNPVWSSEEALSGKTDGAFALTPDGKNLQSSRPKAHRHGVGACRPRPINITPEASV